MSASAPHPAPPDSFVQRVQEIGLELEPRELDLLGRYLALLLDANTRFNLTAITDPQRAWMRHILDSLALAPLLIAAEAKTVIDVGSGGGLPGIPLAIALAGGGEAGVHFTLLEATGKKGRFLQQVIGDLRLDNATVVNERAETAGQDHHRYRERFDAVIARAVGRLPVLLELTVPFAKVGGLVLAMKGEQAETEIADAKQALHMLHAHVIDRIPITWGGGGGGGDGVIVVIEKQRKTPRNYPRPPGEPNRAPLH